MEIDPRQLRQLLAVARAGSLIGAAERLNVSQPALSVGISRLEDRLGTRLMERGRHGATLNEAGQILLRHAQSVERVLSLAWNEIELHKQGIAGPLVIGGTPLATSSIIPACVARLCEEIGPAAVDILEGVDEELVEKLLRHEIDVAIGTISMGPRPPEIVETPLFHARIVLVVRPSHPLARRKTLSLTELTDTLWIMPPAGGAFRALLEALFVTTRLAFPTNVVQAAPFGVIKEMIRQSDGVTLLSDQIIGPELRDGTLHAIPLKEQTALRLFGLQTLEGRQLNPLGQRFCELAVEAAHDYDIA